MLVKLVGELARCVPKAPRPDPLPSGTPWQGVILARVATYLTWSLGWAGAIAVILLALAYAAAKLSTP